MAQTKAQGNGPSSFFFFPFSTPAPLNDSPTPHAPPTSVTQLQLAFQVPIQLPINLPALSPAIAHAKDPAASFSTRLHHAADVFTHTAASHHSLLHSKMAISCYGKEGKKVGTFE